jgi:hypothetical protein
VHTDAAVAAENTRYSLRSLCALRSVFSVSSTSFSPLKPRYHRRLLFRKSFLFFFFSCSGRQCSTRRRLQHDTLQRQGTSAEGDSPDSTRRDTDRWSNLHLILFLALNSTIIRQPSSKLTIFYSTDNYCNCIVFHCLLGFSLSSPHHCPSLL